MTDSAVRAAPGSLATGRPRQIVAAARALLEEEGPEALTMRRLAERVGFRASSLYKYFPDKSSVVAALAAEMYRETAAVLTAAEASAPGSFPVLATAYRTYALAHPHLYLLATGCRPDLPALAPDRRKAAAPSTGPSPATRTAPGPPGRSRTAWSSSN